MSEIVTQTVVVEGLESHADILLDRWGVAHIRADTQHDLFFAQGFNAARDRLWQIDMWRKRGLGKLAEDFGPGYLEQDRASRLFIYRGEMAPEWQSYAEDAEAICTAFVTGINAYISEALAGRVEMPPEFSLMGTRPAFWQAEDVVRIRSHSLTRNVVSEVVRHNVLAESGEKADRMRVELSPPVAPIGDPDVPPGSVPLAALEIFNLATTDVRFSDERLGATLDQASRWRLITPLGDVVMAGEGQGSNNWVISGSRTVSGRPIMASDPHRTFELPSVRYITHLKGAGIDVIGAGEAAVPGIALGHNGHSAFSLTIFGADQEDMYVYETDPDDPLRYRYNGGWERMEVVTETLAVKGAADQKIDLKFTRHGPVVHEETGRAFAIRTVWTDPGTAPYMASLSVMRAKSFDAYRKALEGWGTPSINHIYADVTGTIGWQAVGRTPIRPNWNGLVPVPGDGRYEWQGNLSLDELPHIRDPERGFIATANEMNLPEGWDHSARAIGYEWLDRSRADRIHAVLDADPAQTIEASGRLQNDVHSEVARRILRVLEGVSLGTEAGEAAAHLQGWDCRATADSAQAFLLEYWLTRHLKPALFAACDAASDKLLWPGSIQSVLAFLEQPEDWFESEACSRRDMILSESLAAAWGDALESFGSPKGWKWGDLHKLTFAHRLSPIQSKAQGWSLPAMNIGGTGSTTNYANYRIADFQAITGPSVRLLMDVGEWDNSRFINLPGQSGMPDSPHYSDLSEAWRDGVYYPLVYTDQAVEEATEFRLRLEAAS